MDLSQERQQRTLVLRFKRVPAQQRQAIDVAGLQQPEQLFFCFPREGLSVTEIPGFRLEASGTMISAARYKQGNPDA